MSTELSRFEEDLRARAENHCELCGADRGLSVRVVPPSAVPDLGRCILACATCVAQLEPAAALDATHWFCLREAAWSGVAAVQVTSWRLLQRLDESWARELLETLYMPEETLAWAQSGAADVAIDSDIKTVDSNGAELVDGDSVTLIKDLDIKGAGFTAKRGTLVKNIRLTDDPENVDGRVNKIAIVLKTCFLKKA